MLLLPFPDVPGVEEAAGGECRGCYSGGASGEPDEGNLVYTVVGRPFGDEVKRGVHVGTGMLAHHQTVVTGHVAQLVRLVEYLAEPGMRRPGRNTLFQRVAQVDPLEARQ